MIKEGEEILGQVTTVFIGECAHDSEIDRSVLRIGRVADVPNFGAGDMLEIRPNTGQSFFLPFTKEVVPEIDLERGIVVVVPLSEVSERDEDVKSNP